MDQAIESNLGRILVLVILLTRLQASTARYSRRNPPTASPKFGQSESGIHNVFIFSGMLSGRLIKRELKSSQVNLC